jgi:hypothetical protein
VSDWHLWYGSITDTFYFGKARAKDSRRPHVMVAVGPRREVSEADVARAFRAWLLDRQDQWVEFPDGVIQWVPKPRAESGALEPAAAEPEDLAREIRRD